MRQPFEALVDQIAARLRTLGLSDAAGQARVIAGLAMQLAYPEIVASARAAEGTADYARRRASWETAQLPSLRYALVMCASGLDDGGAFARQSLRTYREGPDSESLGV